jgi:zinc transport system substrate-binding protein
MPVVAAVLTGMLALTGCKEQPSSPRTILASFYPVYVAALNVTAGVPGIHLKLMAPPTAGCPHDYQMTPQDAAALETARVFVTNGAGMEHFVDKAAMKRPGLTVIDASAGIPLLSEQMRPDSVHRDVNPHVWMSVTNEMMQVNNIAEGLATLDTANAAQYRANAAAYVTRLDSLQRAIRSALAGVRERRIVTFHESFAYFAQEFGLVVVATMQSDPSSDPSAADLAALAATMKQQRLTALFTETAYPSKSAQALAREVGAHVYALDGCVAGPLEPSAYLDAMGKNLVVLRGALQ